MTSKVHLAGILSSLRLLRDGAAVEDKFQGENGEEFSQNGPSYL